MKTALFAIFLSVHSQNIFAADAAGQFQFTEKECHDLAQELSDDAFENEKKLDSMKIANHFSAETVKYLNETKINFSKDLNNLCSTKKDNVTFDDIYKVESSCKETCKENLKIIKTPFLKIVEDLNKTKEISESTCYAICDKDQDKLDAMRKGMTLALKSKSSPDCSGAVSDSGRNKSKTTALEQIVEKVKTSAK